MIARNVHFTFLVDVRHKPGHLNRQRCRIKIEATIGKANTEWVEKVISLFHQIRYAVADANEDREMLAIGS